MSANGMSANGMSANGMSANGMSANGLSAGTLTPGNAAAIQDPGEQGDNAREFMSYVVSCALTPSQHLDFSWTDEAGAVHNESYYGALGLAPNWALGPLDVSGQQWVSACLAARVNALGVHVPLSLRGTHPALAVTQTERQNYGTREAVWFGNIFTSNPAVYACYDPVNFLLADLDKRVCAQPVPGVFDCGIIHVLGPCFGLSALGAPILTVGFCPYVDPNLGYLYGCTAGSGSSYPAITSFLANPL
jgi:hypothetical protein